MNELPRTPSHKSPPKKEPGQKGADEGGGSFDWPALVPLIAHPTKVAVIEALAYIDRPLSATLLNDSFDCDWSLSHVSYHVTSLAKLGVLKRMGQRPVRGAVERFYFFPPQE